MTDLSPDPHSTPLGTPRHSPSRTVAPDTTPWAPESVAGDAKLTELRDLIAATNANEFLHCDFDQFQSHYFPFTPSQEDMTRCTTALSEVVPSSLWSNEGKVGFTLFKKGGAETEPATFAPLADIADALKPLKIQGRSYNKFPLLNVPYANTTSDINGGNHRIDACLHWVDGSTSLLRMTEIVVPMEYKLKYNEDDVRKNRAQLLSAVHHIMHDDARRKWVYGLTIEGDRVSVWYFSRSHCTKATSFSFVKHPRRLLSILICLMFSTKTELGFDPNVTLMPDRTYIYRLPATDTQPEKFYRTVQSLFEPRTLCMSGRMSRVWKVQEIESWWNCVPVPGTSPQVLKDVWLDASSPTEGDIQRELFDDVRKFASGDWRNDEKIKDFDEVDKDRLETFLEGDNFKELFLCVQQDHVGNPIKPTPPKCSTRSDLFKSHFTQTLAANHAITTVTQRSNHPNQPPASGQPEKQLIYKIHRQYSPRRRCFFVYDEVCKPLHDLTTVGHVVDALEQALIALQIMFCAGWVHRDVSSGNILAFPLTGTTYQAKLSDLEYAKKFSKEILRHSDPKTGTAFFMAAEVQSRQHIYRKPNTRMELKDRAKWDEDTDDSASQMDQYNTERMPIVHTFQHDLESLWWITFWIVTMRVAHKPSSMFAVRYFQNNSYSTTDRMELVDKGFSQNITDILSTGLRSFGTPLKLLLRLLRVSYWANGMDDQTRDPTAYTDIHSHFALFFRKLQASREGWEAVEVTPYRSEPILTKRKRSDDDDNRDAQKMVVFPANQGSPTRPRAPKGKGKETPTQLNPLEDAPSSFKKARVVPS